MDDMQLGGFRFALFFDRKERSGGRHLNLALPVIRNPVLHPLADGLIGDIHRLCKQGDRPEVLDGLICGHAISNHSSRVLATVVCSAPARLLPWTS